MPKVLFKISAALALLLAAEVAQPPAVAQAHEYPSYAAAYARSHQAVSQAYDAQANQPMVSVRASPCTRTMSSQATA